MMADAAMSPAISDQDAFSSVMSVGVDALEQAVRCYVVNDLRGASEHLDNLDLASSVLRKRIADA